MWLCLKIGDTRSHLKRVMIIHWNWGYPTFKSTCRKVLLLALPLVVTLDRYLGMLKNMLLIHDKKHSRFFVFYPTCQHCYLFKTIQFGRTLDFFWANPSLSVSLWLKDPRSLCSWPSIWDVAKSGGHSQQVGIYNTVKLSKHRESTDCWWGLDAVPQKRSARGLRNQAILRVVGLPRNLGSTMPH